MCVDDYEFRHPTATRQKQCRRFVFQTQFGEERTFLVNISQFQQSGYLRLCEILMHLNKKGLNVKDYRFHLPKFNVSIEAGDQCQAPFSLFSDKQIIFEMQLIEEEHEGQLQKLYHPQMGGQNQIDIEPPCQQCGQQVVEKQMQSFSDKKQQLSQNNDSSPEYSGDNKEQSNKKTKQLQKTIFEALTKTKQWRMIHEKYSISLKNAAKMVNISKKTLDDYFLTFRVAEHYGYNVQENMDKKIGHMRNFIRQQPQKLKGRQPKHIKSFSLIDQPDLSHIPQITDWSKMEEIEEEKNEVVKNQQKSNQMKQ